MDKIVKGATKIKLAAPKTKYIEPILAATYDNVELGTVMRCLMPRIKDANWTIALKALIIVHIMFREGEQDAAMRYVSKHPKMLEVKKTVLTSVQGTTLMRYAHYLHTRAIQYGQTGCDYVRHRTNNHGRLKTLSVEKGLLRECESVLRQIESLLKCRFHEEEINNDILLSSFRLLVYDLLNLYQVLNEGVINVLEHYFEMSKVDCERALDVYKDFSDQTASVVGFLKIAKRLEFATKLVVPNIKHAPTSLTESLENYLKDPDFEINRRQYLAELEAKRDKIRKPTGSLSRSDSRATLANSQSLYSQIEQVQGRQPPPLPALIDVFQKQIPTQSLPITSNSPAPALEAAIGPTTGKNPFTMTSPQPQENLFSAPSQYHATGFSGSPVWSAPQPQIAQPTGILNPSDSQPTWPLQQSTPSTADSFTAQSFMTGNQLQNGYMTQAMGQSTLPLQQQKTGVNPFRTSTMPVQMSMTGGQFAVKPQDSNPFSYVDVNQPIMNPSFALLQQQQIQQLQQQLQQQQQQQQQQQEQQHHQQQQHQQQQQQQLHRSGASFVQPQQMLPQNITGPNPFRFS